jgi:beta-galactosidase/beta-glucuronidase
VAHVSRAGPPAAGLVTRWAALVDPAAPLPEYPRPQLTRPDWLTLNGVWDLAVTGADDEAPGFAGAEPVLVPFPVESALSGVRRAVTGADRLWYRRSFAVPDAWAGRRVLLHFGAVDCEAQVLVNGAPAGGHTGGYAPFTLDVTDLLRRDGHDELVVAVRDATDGERGKQSLRPRDIWYTAYSGIWQTVWLEPVPESHVTALLVATSVEHGTVDVQAELAGPVDGLALEVTVTAGEEVVGEVRGPADGAFSVGVEHPRPWSPDDPFLYGLTVRLLAPDGTVVDEVGSYAGIRTVTVERAPDGRRRFFLNGRPVFQSGVLDQGYWPDGIATAPTDEALAFDVEAAKRLGFTMIRKHAKVEPARWYHHCDRLGMLVWQDMPSGGPVVDEATRPAPVDRLFALADRLGVGAASPLGRAVLRRTLWRPRWLADARTPASKAAYEAQLRELVVALRNAPSIVGWVPFNEGWGQFDAPRIAAQVAALDPTRPVDHASGWYDHLVGDVVSYHDYGHRPRLPVPERLRGGRAIALTEYGGLTLVVPGHVWHQEDGHTYRAVSSSDELDRGYARLLARVRELKAQGLALAVLTQLTDVEGELNGLLTYDRAVVKVDEAASRALHRALVGG